MRKVIEPQMQMGEQDIGSIQLDLKSRDDIPQILLGLQHIYTTPELRKAVWARSQFLGTEPHHSIQITRNQLTWGLMMVGGGHL